MQFQIYLSLIATLVLNSFLTAESCSCDLESTQTKFCNADYVVKVRVLSRSHVGEDWPNGELEYRIKLLKVYKRTDKFDEVPQNHIMSPDNDGMCGAFLSVDETYLLAGNVFNGKLDILSCDWVSLWHFVTSDEQIGINGGYAKRCK